MLKKSIFPILFFVLFCTALMAQNDPASLDDPTHTHNGGTPVVNSDYHKAPIEIDEEAIKKHLRANKGKIILPFRDEQKVFKTEEFKFYAGDVNPVPGVQTYRLYPDDKSPFEGRIVIGPAGVNISYIDRGVITRVYYEYQGDGKAYYEEWGQNPEEVQYVECLQKGHEGHVHEEAIPPVDNVFANQEEMLTNMKLQFGEHKRVFRVAVVTSAEYRNNNGNSSTSAKQRAIENIVDISLVFETQINVHFVQAPNSPRADYSDPGADPFNGVDANDANDEVRDRFFDRNYDIGHALHSLGSGGSGLAGVGVACVDGSKGRGMSGFSGNTGTSWISLAAHEFGHQLGSPHTFSGDGANCAGDQFPDGNAYEIASGMSLMSYKGICGEEWNISDVVGDSRDVAFDFLHASSLERITNHLNSSAARECNIDMWELDTNTPPVANANPCGATYSIPTNTKFFIRGEATDADGDPMTYSWEQYDRATRTEQGNIGNDAATSKVGPLFRCYAPNGNLERHFPRISNQLYPGNTNDPFEVLPRTSRSINMRLVVRDNNPGGTAIDWDQITIQVVSSAFRLTAPISTDEFVAGGELRVEWEPGAAPNICDNVQIRMSLDGNNSFPVLLQGNVDFAKGFQTVTLPSNIPSDAQVGIQVLCSDYDCFGFYDNTDFVKEVTSPCTTAESGICDETELVVDFRDPSLDFGKLAAVGSPLHVYDGRVADDAASMSVARFNNAGTDCATSGSSDFHLMQITPTVTGDYFFEFSNNNDGNSTIVSAYSIFEKEGFSTGNPCGTFVASNATGNTIRNFLRQELEACKEYYLVAYATDSNARNVRIFRIEGSGEVLLAEEDKIDSEIYYVAVDVADNRVKYQNNDANFELLDPGSYRVYSIVLESGSPASWIGKTINEIALSDDCVTVSENYKPITVNASCAILNLETSLASACNSNNNLYSLNVSFEVDRGPTSGTVTITTQNGQSQDFNLTSGRNSVVLDNLLADGRPVNLTFSFSSDSGCLKTEFAVFTAPENCCEIRLDLGNQDVCIGQPAILDAGTDGESYQWFYQGEPLSFTGNILEATDPGGYTVIVTDSNGCQKDDDTSVSFSTPPIVNISTGDIEGCDGTTERINSIVTNYDSIAWIINGVVDPDYENQRNITIDRSGQYELRAFNNGCAESDFINADFRPSEPVFLGEDIDDCIGVDVEITAESNATNFRWKQLFVTNGDFTETSNTITVNEEGTYVAFSVADNGCEASDTVRVRLEDIDKADLELGDPQRECEGSFFRLSVIPSPVNWYLNDELIVGFNRNTLNSVETGTYIVEQVVSENCFARDTVEITVYPLPPVDLGPNLSFCEGAVIDTSIYAGETFEYDYRWARNGEQIFNARGSQPVQDTGTYRVVVIDDETGCQSVDRITVEYVDNPTIEIVEAPLEICNNEEEVIETVASSEGVAWFLDGELTSLRGSIVEITEPGTYRAVIADGQACSVEDVVVVGELPSPELNLPERILGCEGQPYEIVAGPSDWLYDWFYNGREIPNQRSESYVTDSIGQYIIRADNGICTVLDTLILEFADAAFVTLPDDVTYCEGEVNTIIASSNAFELSWYRGNVKLDETGKSLVVTEPGVYFAFAQEGQDCEALDAIEVSFSPSPVISIDDVTLCEGESAIFVAGDDDEFGYTWFVNDEPIVNNGGTLTIESSDLSTLTAEVRVVASNLTDDCTGTAVANLTFIAGSTVELTADGPYCVDEPVDVVATTNENRLAWYLNGILQDETSDIYTATQSGEYLAIAGTGQCTQRDSLTIQFEEKPDIFIKDQALCMGETAIFTAGPDGAYAYQWFFNGQLQASTSGTFMSTIAGDVRVVATDTNSGCETELEAELTFIASPSLNVIPVQEECYGTETKIRTATSAQALRWFYEGEELPFTSRDIDITEPGTYTVIAGNGDCQVERIVEVAFEESPDISLEDQSQCQSEDAVFVAGADGEYVYEWYLDGELQANSSGTFIVQAGDVENNSGEVTVEATFLNGGCSIELTAEANFISSPVLEIDQVTEFCSGEPAVIMTSTNVSSLTWFRNNVELSATGINLEITEAGTYRAEAGSGTCAVEDMITVSFVDAPDISISSQSLCQGETAIFTAGADDAYDYDWFINDQPITNNTGSLQLDESNITGTSAEIKVTATNKTNDCFTTSEATLEFIASPSLALAADGPYCEDTPGVITSEVMNVNSLVWYQDNELLDETGLTLEVSEDGTYRAEAGTGPCAVSDEVTISFSDVPVVMINSQQACQNETAVFVAGEDDEYNYQWFINDVEQSNTAGTLSLEENNIPSSPSTVRVVATNKTDACFSESEATIEFITSPSLEIVEVEGLCKGDVATIITNTQNVSTLTWYLDDELLASDALNLEITEDGEYRAEAGTGDCAVSETIMVVFEDKPDVELVNQEACSGEEITIVAGDDDAYTYTWYINDVEQMTTSGTLVVNNDQFPSDLGEIRLVATNLNSPCFIDQTVSVEFFSTPRLEVLQLPDFCNGEEAEILMDTDAANLKWFIDDVEQDETGSSFLATEDGSYEVVAGVGDCAVSVMIEVEFADFPDVQLTNISVCDNEDAVIIAGDDDAYVYAWSLNGQPQLNETAGTYIISADDVNSNSGTVTLNVSNLTNNCSITEEIEVDFIAAPELSIDNTGPFCSDEAPILTTITNVNSLEWTLDDEMLSSSDLELAITESGQYIAKAGDGDCAVLDTIDVVINIAPEIELANITKCSGEDAEFVAGPDGAYDYTWVIDGETQMTTSGTLVVTSDDLLTNSGVVSVLAVDDASGCDTEVSADIEFIQTPTLEIEPVVALCEGEETEISTLTNVDNLTWFLDNERISQTDATITIDESGLYLAIAGNGNCEVRDSVQVDFTAAPVLDLSGPSAGCGDDTVTLNLDSDTNAEVIWMLGAGVISGESGTSIEVVEAGVYTAEVINDDGCRSTESIEVDFFDYPMANVGNLPTGICEGVDFEVEADSNGDRFEWLDSSGAVIGTAITQDFSQSGDYTFVAYNEADCATEVEFTLEFRPAPEVDLGDNLTFCEGDVATLSVANQANVDYVWSLDGEPLSEDSNTLDVTASGEYTLEATNDIGCTTTDFVLVSVVEFPTLSGETEVSFCAGETAVLQVDSDVTDITWTLGGQVVASGVRLIEVTEGGDYTVTATAGDDCSVDETVTVTEIAVADINLADVELCPGDDPQSISIQGDFDTYLWTGEVSASTAEVSIAYKEVNTITTETINVIASKEGCESRTSLQVTYYPVLMTTVESTTLSICEGESVALSVGGGSNYSWSDPSGTLSATDIANPTASPTSTTNYEVTISDDICPNTFEVVTITVTVNPLPIADAGEDISTIPGEPVTLDASGGVDYEWDNEDAIIGARDVSDPEVLLEESTTFTVTVTDSNGCSATDDVNVEVVVDATLVIDVVDAFSPNNDGANDVLIFDGLDLFPENLLTIFNRWGNVVYQKRAYQINGDMWDGTRNGEALPAGTYYYILEFGEFKVKNSLTLIRD